MPHSHDARVAEKHGELFASRLEVFSVEMGWFSVVAKPHVFYLDNS